MKRIIVTPAGRKKYLEILYQYLLKAFKKGEFHEWHLWMNTKNEVDNLYMNELAKNNEWIKLIYWCEEKIYPECLSHNLWDDIHKFFPFDAADPDSVYLRLDDDIVYVEDGAINNMFEFRMDNPKYFLVYGNIINNSVLGHIHQRLGIVDYSKGVNSYACLCNVGWKSNEYAELVHNTFLANVEVKELEKYKFPRWELWGYEHVSINAISWFGERFAKFKGVVAKDEEKALAMDMPRQFGEMSCINGQAIFSHYAFFTQRDYLDSKTDILDRYSKLAGIDITNNLIQAIGMLKDAKKSELKSRMFLVNIIRTAGLFYDERDVYGDDKLYMNKKGDTGIWQIPMQLAELLIELSNHKINSYLDIGTLTGYTFSIVATYLQRFNPEIELFALDPIPAINPKIKELLKFKYIQDTTDSIKDMNFDFVFIDGFHSYDCVKSDYENVGKKAKFVAVHDIQDEFVGYDANPKVWNEIKEGKMFKEFTYHSHRKLRMGIGLLIQNKQVNTEN